jgi:hypothetical protein
LHKKEEMCREGMIDSEKDVNGERTRKWLFIITEKAEKTEENENFCSFCGF